jgi:hypothetical protein
VRWATLDEYERSNQKVADIYDADRKEGKCLVVSVAMSADQLAAGGAELEKWLTEKKLDELGAVLIRELLKQKRPLLITTSETGPSEWLVPEARMRWQVNLFPVERVKP